MKVRNGLIGIQLLSMTAAFGSALYIRAARHKANVRDLRQVRSLHDVRREQPIAIRYSRYERLAFVLYGLLGGVVITSLGSRRVGLWTLGSALLASGISAGTLALRYEFIKSDDRRLDRMYAKMRIVDLGKVRRRHAA